jgi:hypothetical protein
MEQKYLVFTGISKNSTAFIFRIYKKKLSIEKCGRDIGRRRAGAGA